MFGSQRERLLRTKWPNAYMLALELYAMMGDEVPNATTQPLGINPAAGLPSLVLGNQTIGDSLFQVKGADGGVLGDIIIGPDNFVIFVPNGQKKPTPPKAQPSVFAGQVVSGTGDTYTVKIFPSGRTKPGVNVSVKQLQIDTTKKVKAGTWVLVVQELDGKYCMQHPVFT